MAAIVESLKREHDAIEIYALYKGAEQFVRRLPAMLRLSAED